MTSESNTPSVFRWLGETWDVPRWMVLWCGFALVGNAIHWLVWG